MINTHLFISSLAPAAVFDVLRYFGSALNTSGRGVGLMRAQESKTRFSDAPTVEIGKLLLHFAWESHGKHNGIFDFYLFNNNRELMQISHALTPDYTEWDVAANQILDKIRDEVNIFCHNDQWHVVCTNSKYRLVPEIDLLLHQFEKPKSIVNISNSKNIVVDSEIMAGKDVQIGDVERIQTRADFLPTPAMVLQAAQFSAQMRIYLEGNKVEEAINAGLIYTQLLYPDAHEEITKIHLNLQHLSRQYNEGHISFSEAQIRWGQVKNKLADIVSYLTTWK